MAAERCKLSGELSFACAVFAGYGFRHRVCRHLPPQQACLWTIRSGGKTWQGHAIWFPDRDGCGPKPFGQVPISPLPTPSV